MTASTTAGIVVAAGVIGVTHGLEPDHVAGISALTGGLDDSSLSAIVGGCFAIGHVILVVGWVVGASLLLDVTSFPPAMESIGLVAVGVVLVALSAALGVSAARRLVHRHEHRHGGRSHAHFHVHWFGHDHVIGAGHRHDHTLREYLKIGTIGALFTLSPPLSMIVFISMIVSNAAPAVVVAAVLAYAMSITVTMGLVGYGAGTAFQLAHERGPRVHAALQLAVAAVVLAIAATLLRAHLPMAVGW